MKAELTLRDKNDWNKYPYIAMSLSMEKQFLEAITESTSISTVDIFRAERKEYVDKGEDMVEYKWHEDYLGKEKLDELKDFAMWLYKKIHTEINKN